MAVSDINERDRDIRPDSEPAEPHTDAARRDRSMAGLATSLLHDISMLFRQEIRLAQVETSEKVSQIGNAVTLLAAGGLIAFYGFLFLLLSATIALENWVAAWLAALIVGGVVLIIGLILLSSGRSKLKGANMKPEHTIHSLRDDASAASSYASSR